MKRKQLVHTAKDLFWKYGIKRVTVAEICQEANVSKMTFYKHFKNKNELVMVMITQMTDEAVEKYRAIMAQDIPFGEKVRQSIESKFKSTDQMSQKFFSDYYPHAEPELVEFVQGNMEKALGMIIKDYAEAQKKGEIRKDIKIEFILYFLKHMMEMMKDEQLESMYGSPQEMIMEFTNFFFYGIMPRN